VVLYSRAACVTRDESTSIIVRRLLLLLLLLLLLCARDMTSDGEMSWSSTTVASWQCYWHTTKSVVIARE